MTKNVKAPSMSFRIAPGARIPRADAKTIGLVFDKIKQTGPLTAETVLAEASSASSPLHKYFEWDDSKAARQFRLEQARRLVRSIEVVIEEVKGKKVETHTMRAHFSVEDGVGQRSYMPMQFVFQDADMADQVIQAAYNALQSWVQKYKTYQWGKAEIPRIIAVMNSLQKKLKKTKKKKTKKK